MINLLSLNGFVTITKFKVEIVPSMLESIRKGDVMVPVDLKNVYFQIFIHPDS